MSPESDRGSKVQLLSQGKDIISQIAFSSFTRLRCCANCEKEEEDTRINDEMNSRKAAGNKRKIVEVQRKVIGIDEREERGGTTGMTVVKK